MGKPRLIILVRHAQSEGNKNRAIHQIIPDHRVKLTEEGHRQAEDAGRRLRAQLKPDDTLQIFTSPYRRTRETTEGILKTLTAHSDPSDPSAAPSPFSRSKIKVYEEPRLREQDFGNFQPCSAEMERMWRERADYGHFFYRIPNGESAADAYDRVSGFNESLWRQFGDKEFPSVLVLVTHGLMTRIFLMKWYHWSVEYFEDLRNVSHCEFILMRQNMESGKYVLESQLRTWSELRRQREAEARIKNPQRRNTLSSFLGAAQPQQQQPKNDKSPSIPAQKWGGCVDGCDHEQQNAANKETKKAAQDVQLPPAADTSRKAQESRRDKHTSASNDPLPQSFDTDGTSGHLPSKSTLRAPSHLPAYLARNVSGTSTPHEMPSDEEEADGYFDSHGKPTGRGGVPAGAMAQALRERKPPERKPTPEDIERWVNESGMGRGKKADALGDEPAPEVEDWVQGEEEFTVKKVEDELDKAEAEDKSLRGSVY